MNDATYAAEVAASWQAVTAAALLGTERQPPRSLEPGGPLGDIIRQSAGASTERGVLLAAAALSLFQRAGTPPSRFEGLLPGPCTLDDLPRCTPGAARALAAILEGPYGDVLPEWLGCARSAGLRASEETLPALLEAGHNNGHLEDAIADVVGERGRWLAGQNPDWEYAASSVTAGPGQTQAQWQTRSRPVRLALLRRLRRTDPQAARGLLESTLAEEGAEARAEFVSTLQIGLIDDDEPFLESILDDRSREVRHAAAPLLAALTGSRFVQRMTARARSLLEFQRGRPPKNARVLVTLPDRCDPAMSRDAVDARPRQARSTGQRATWLLQIVSAVPPSFWSREWNQSPSDILQAASHNEDWKEVLVQCWAQAAANHRDHEWASAMLHSVWAVPMLSSDAEKRRLLEVLPAEEAQDFLVERLRTQPVVAAMDLILSYSRPWSQELTRDVIRVLQHYSSNLDLPWQSSAAARHMALLMDPGLAGEAQLLGNSAERGSSWQRVAESIVPILEFRQNMIKELTS